jgi:hypothetical protein
MKNCDTIEHQHIAYLALFEELHVGIVIGDFRTVYPHTGQFGHLISSTMNLYSTW